MAKSERGPSGLTDDATQDAKTVARAGPAGVLLVTVIILALLAAIVFGVMLLGSSG